MAETINVVAPAILLVQNNGDTDAQFIPYRENFKVTIPGNSHVLFPVMTTGQVLYYFNQQYGDLSIRIFDAETELEMDNFIPVFPANYGNEEPYVITLANVSEKVVNFIPYKENFAVDIAAEDEMDITVSNIGQVFYYMAQQTDGLEVDAPTRSIGINE